MTYLAVEKCIQALNSSNLEALYFQVLINDTQSVIFFR